jgi:hypothetical protein
MIGCVTPNRFQQRYRQRGGVNYQFDAGWLIVLCDCGDAPNRFSGGTRVKSGNAVRDVRIDNVA